MPELNVRLTSACGSVIAHFRQNLEVSALVFFHLPTDTHTAVKIPRARTDELIRVMERTAVNHGATMELTV
tara:strand:- start:37 stop:249 length:213 start_codon:yes stop_codon:yes gene_type:complete